MKRGKVPGTHANREEGFSLRSRLGEMTPEEITPTEVRNLIADTRASRSSLREQVEVLWTFREVACHAEKVGHPFACPSWAILYFAHEAMMRGPDPADPFAYVDAIRTAGERLEFSPWTWVYAIELGKAIWGWEDDPTWKYKPFSNRDYKGFLPSELRLVREALIEEGHIPEPAVNVEATLTHRWYGATVLFRWTLARFRLRPESRIACLLNRIRPGMGGFVSRHGVRGHWRNQWYPSLQAHKLIWINDYETEGGE